MSNFWPAVGGMIHLEYTYGDSKTVHPIKLAVAPFDLTPSGPDGDYLYTDAGPTHPTEAGVRATCDAIAARWAPYYDPNWWLRLRAVYKIDDGAAVLLPTCPMWYPRPGTYADPVKQSPVFKRTLMLWGARPLDQRWRIFLRQIQGDRSGQTLDVWPDAGGFDARDPAWYAYLGSSATGVVARNGWGFQTGGQVRQWSDAALPCPYDDDDDDD